MAWLRGVVVNGWIDDGGYSGQFIDMGSQRIRIELFVS
jgi:hypothetical protein